MIDLPISAGCDRLGVWFMSDDVSEEMQETINEKANEIFGNAQEEFDKFLEMNGYEWLNGVIKKKKEMKSDGKDNSL